MGKEASLKPKSGAGTSANFQSSWPWFSCLSWLKDHIEMKDTYTNLSPESSFNIDDEMKTKKITKKRK